MTVSPPVEPSSGGSFLIERHSAADIQIPESFDEELRLVGQTASRFVEREILPDFERLEALDYDLSRAKLLTAGELGLLAVDIPEAYGGLELSKSASLLVAEKLARSGSFNVTFNAHTCIGTLPIVYFGSEAQKERWLPLLASGEAVAAYCLTEPGSGSDARAAKTRAVPSADGSTFTLDGTKMWITNAGFADLFIVFAQVVERAAGGESGAESTGGTNGEPGGASAGLGADGRPGDSHRFTAFLVERGTPGLSFGAEERKMGIKGSSTRQVILENVRIPAANVLGEVGKGHKIAFSILNLGRLKLAAGAVGGVKEMLRLGAVYAQEREQFGRPIARFGLIQEKLGAMAARAYSLESAVYRLVGEVDRRSRGRVEAAERLVALDEYVIEYSLIKVCGSEILDDAIDETLQVFGGNGYSAEYPVELAYRNSRINRIFEGTNEINRLLVSGQLLKRALAGRLDLLGPGEAALRGTVAEPVSASPGLGAAFGAVEGMKRAVLLVAAAAAIYFREQIEAEQELLARVADMTALVYLAESGLLRAERLAEEDRFVSAALLARLYAFGAVDSARNAAMESLRRIPGGADHVRALRAHLPEHGQDLVELRREAAEATYRSNGYPLS
jgi:alkylation response protein AidB-like acyl-CoA dehydrogenase